MHLMAVEARETAVKDREVAVSIREADLAERVAKCDKKKKELLAELRLLAEHVDKAWVSCSSCGSCVHCCLFRGWRSCCHCRTVVRTYVRTHLRTPMSIHMACGTHR